MARLKPRFNKRVRTISTKITTKIVRVDERTQIEVPVHISDEVAIERFLQRRNQGPRPPLIVPKPAEEEEELIIPEEISELGDESEPEENEEGDN